MLGCASGGVELIHQFIIGARSWKLEAGERFGRPPKSRSADSVYYFWGESDLRASQQYSAVRDSVQVQDSVQCSAAC